MRTTFQQCLSELVSLGPFRRCGTSTELTPKGLTWPIVTKMVSDESWGDFLVERSNDLRRHVHPLSVERYNQWNSFSAPARASWKLVGEDVRMRSALDDGIWRKVEATVGWYLVLAAVEEAYADLGGPDWHRQMCEWLCQGYFPCGWDGEFPKGQPIIF